MKSEWTRKQLLIAAVIHGVILIAAVAVLIILLRHFYGNASGRNRTEAAETGSSETLASETVASETASEVTVAESTDSTERTEASSESSVAEVSDDSTEEVSDDSTEETSSEESVSEASDEEEPDDVYKVKVSIPAEYVMEDFTEERIAELESDEGIRSVRVREDGSVIYILTEEKHAEMLQEMAASFNETLHAMIESEEYPNFTDVSADENYTLFAVTTKSAAPDENEAASVQKFYKIGGMYNCFRGEPADNIQVLFFNADTLRVISEMNSSDADGDGAEAAE